ncbi:MAG: XdhC family protein [SAR324 cluster bacterium]|nr:XdhC family protein [SAR324 cluster bacterium]
MDRTLELSRELSARAEPFATALVVRCDPPTSAKPGAKAVVTAEGAIVGWIGGGCAQPIVIEQAQAALREGTPRLIRISPDQGLVEVHGMINFAMACHSGGTLDIFIEPVLPPVQLVVMGRSPVAQALCRLGKAMGYGVAVHAPGALPGEFPDADGVADTLELSGLARPERAFVIVSSQGEYDEDALEAALGVEAAYTAFVASKTKWGAIQKTLKERGCKSSQLERVKVPAGLDIHAVEAEEIALSVLAEIVSLIRGGALASRTGAEQARPQADQATDPICNMSVRIEGARYVAEHGGAKYYFCCAACKQSFEKEPGKYAQAS